MPFFLSAILMVLLLKLVYSHFQYYVDPDGAAYLTIAKRYASGDYQRAINGYWSPWGCWLTALLIKQGIAAILSSVIVNTAAAIGFLYISQSFFLKFDIERELQWVLCVTLAFFLSFAIFWQSFDDLWECFFLLCGLRIMLGEGFRYNPGAWIIMGITGTLAYFAKAYSFPFFILNTICCGYFIVKKDKGLWMKMCVVSIGIMVLCSLPWIWILHSKYGIWTTSTAGSLNLSWYLVGHPYWKDGMTYMLPPVYHNSPFYWEDPFMVNARAPHFWNSFQLAGLQLIRLVFTGLKFINSMFQVSVFLPFLFLLMAVNLISLRRRALLTDKMSVAALSFLLFPAGYMLINFESRYLWYMLPLGMTTGAILIQRWPKDKKWSKALTVLFPLSFLIFPFVSGYRFMWNEGRNEYMLADKLKELHIDGSFTANSAPGIERQRVERLAYFSGNPYYYLPYINVPHLQVLEDMRRNKVRYYFYFYQNRENAVQTFTDEQNVAFPLVMADTIYKVKVFLVNP